MYSVASSPPRAPTPRPSSKSLERKRSCSRIRRAERELSGCASTGRTTITAMPIDFIVLVSVTLIQAVQNGLILTVAHQISRGTADLESDPDSPPRARGGKHPHHPGSGCRIPKAGDALLHRQRFVGNGAAGPESVPSGQNPVSLPAHRYHLQVRGNDRVPGRFCAEIGVKLIVHTNTKAIEEG